MMDTFIAKPAPYFDTKELRVELTSLFNRYGTAAEARPEVLARCKSLAVSARREAQHQLEADGKGRKCAHGLARFQDELIALLYDYTTAHVYRATNPSDAERMAIVATGGYGRGLLAPGSDIDILFLLPYKQTSWGESVAEYILYLLWDMGFKVGHATRTVEQCLKMASHDMTIRTALLDIWLVYGDSQLYLELTDRLRHEVHAGTARAFIDAKMSERDERHRHAGESRYKVEPNVKDGKGGLRDLHTLHWLSKYLYGEEVGPKTVEMKIFTPQEYQTFRRSEDFLWSVRCHLHFLVGRAEERLTFDLQPLMAERLGYRAHSGQRAVERFMKHYFLVSKAIGDLTTILCSALEVQQAKTSPVLSGFFGRTTWKLRRQVRRMTDFRIENDRLNVADAQVFKRDPVNLIRFFAQAEYTNSFLHPDAIRLLRQSLRLIDDHLRQDKEANRIFLDLLTAKKNQEVIIRRMNEAGVLGRFIPDFGRIVAMTQFNMYHHYTVDEHLLRTVGMVSEIESGEASSDLPLSSEIIKSIQNRRALYVAAFLHDIGKGREEDHSLVGAKIAGHLCPRLGLSLSETETVVWLIEQHLTMSSIAQSRDILDPKTAQDFSKIVQSPERLKLLMLLTVADIRAVGPGVWNGWKGQLLRTLYYVTEPLVGGGHTQVERKQVVEEAKQQLAHHLKDWTGEELEYFINRHYPDYWLRTETAKQAYHANLIKCAERQGKSFIVDAATDSFTAITELTVFAPNHPRLLAMFAGACAANNANIVGAHISTTRDGFALDTFLLAREFLENDDEHRRAKRIGDSIEKLLKGEIRLKTLLKKGARSTARLQAFTVTPEVIINNGLSDRYTVIEVSGRDRTGLLYELTNILSDLSLDITSAHITTYGEKVVDVFYVTDLTAKKIVDRSRQEIIRKRVLAVLEKTETE